METSNHRLHTAVLAVVVIGYTVGPSLVNGDIDLRLVDGDRPNEGRVAVLGVVGDQVTWGTVCDNNWNESEAEVVCRQLGCNGYIKYTDASTFGNGTGPMFLDNVACNGDESRIQDCMHDTPNCDHAKDAGVVCQLPGYLGCYRDRGRKNRVLPDNRLKTDTVDALMCIQRCFDAGYALAGVRRSDECYCGAADAEYDEQGKERENVCNNECHGDEDLLCGGRDAIGVFNVSAASCPDPGLPLGGARTVDSFIFGSFVDFSCLDEFDQLVGKARLQCVLKQDNMNGNTVDWNGQTPTCQGPSTTPESETAPLTPTTLSSKSPPVTATLASTSTKKSEKTVGAIIGGTVGSILFLAFLLIVLLLIRRSRSKSTTNIKRNKMTKGSSPVKEDTNYYNTATDAGHVDVTEGSPQVNEDTYYSTATDGVADSRLYFTVQPDSHTKPNNESLYYSSLTDPKVYYTVGVDRQTEPEPPVSGTAAASVDKDSSSESEGMVENPIYAGADHAEID